MNTAFSLKDKIILVTGASSGLGREISIKCSEMGATIILLGRNEVTLAETKEMCKGDKHAIVVLDINDKNKVDDFILTAPSFDGLVNAAGIVNTQLFRFLKEDSLGEIMKTNFFAPVSLIQKLVKNKKFTNGGSIVFISSISGPEVSVIGTASYSASKAAITGIAKTMALELASKKIRVNCILPGMIRTNLLDSISSSSEDLSKDEKNYPLGYGAPEDVAYAAIYLLSHASKWVTGINLKLDGGVTLR